MNKKEFEELLLKNNNILFNMMDQKIKDNNEVIFQEMDKKMDKKMDQKIKESEERQNQKFAYFEHHYGEKISAIFDKIQVLDDIVRIQKEESQRLNRIIERHDDILYSQDFRISKLEEKVSSI